MPEMECVIRGLPFARGSGRDALEKLVPGQSVLRLQRLNHPKDQNAVQLLFMGVEVGWVPRELNAGLAADMDAGATATAICTRGCTFERGRITKEAMVRITWTDPR
jgi:hypothetical protein